MSVVTLNRVQYYIHVQHFPMVVVGGGVLTDMYMWVEGVDAGKYYMLPSGKTC